MRRAALTQIKRASNPEIGAFHRGNRERTELEETRLPVA
jgi:hypothetical protein